MTQYNRATAAAEVLGAATRGDVIGELSLLYNMPRTATVRATVASEVWALSRADYQRVLREGKRALQTHLAAQIRSRVRFFAHTHEKQLLALVLAMHPLALGAGEPLVPSAAELSEGLVFRASG